MLYITLASFAIHRWIAIENFWYGVNFSPWYAAQIIGADAWECHSNLWTSSRMLLLFLLPCFPPSSSHNMHKFEFVQIPILAPKKTHTHTHIATYARELVRARALRFHNFFPSLMLWFVCTWRRWFQIHAYIRAFFLALSFSILISRKPMYCFFRTENLLSFVNLFIVAYLALYEIGINNKYMVSNMIAGCWFHTKHAADKIQFWNLFLRKLFFSDIVKFYLLAHAICCTNTCEALPFSRFERKMSRRVENKWNLNDLLPKDNFCHFSFVCIHFPFISMPKSRVTSGCLIVFRYISAQFPAHYILC